MKRIFYLLVFSLLLSCSSESVSGDQSTGGDGFGGSLARFALVGNFLYTVDDQSLRIFDITDTQKPELVGEKFIGFDIETLYGLGEQLFVGSRLGMFIYDISDPVFPLKLAEVQHVRSCDPVVSDGKYAYVTLHTNASCEGNVNQLEIYNVENPLSPNLLQIVQMDRPIGLGLFEEYLVVTDKDVVRVFNVDDPRLPDLVSGIPVDGFDVIIRNNHLFVIGQSALYQYYLNSENSFAYEELSTFTF